jgi:hypothetical protein
MRSGECLECEVTAFDLIHLHFLLVFLEKKHPSASAKLDVYISVTILERENDSAGSLTLNITHVPVDHLEFFISVFLFETE